MTSPPAKKQKMSIAELVTSAPSVPASDDVAAPSLLTADGTWAAAERIQAHVIMPGIPLTVLTGFLGAGKSTILNYILRAPHRLKIAVLINEYGAIDIDSKLVDTSTAYKEGDPVILDNGCICCTVSNGFIDALRKILESASKSGNAPDYIIVETTGLADPKPIIDSIQETELREEIYVDQVLTAVDSSAWSMEHYGSETAKRQIQVADTVLLTKTDLVEETARIEIVLQSIRQIRPNARILRSQSGYVPIHALLDLDIASKVQKSSTDDDGKGVTEESCRAGKQSHCHSEPRHEGHEHHDGHGKCSANCEHTHEPKKRSHLEEEGFSSVSFTTKLPLSMTRFRRDFMEELPDGVFRAKGLLWFSSFSSRFIFHWSGSRYNVEEGEWPEGIERSNQLVVIGRNLDQAAILTMLKSCVVQPGDEESDDEEDEYDEEDELGVGDDGEVQNELTVADEDRRKAENVNVDEIVENEEKTG